MSRQQFRLFVIFNQCLAIALLCVDEATEHSLPADLRNALGSHDSVLSVDTAPDSFPGELPYLLDSALVFVHVIASIGLCLGRRWGRTLFVFCFVALWLTTPFYPFFLTTRWTAMLAYLYGATEGMILALIFFSHLKRMFQSAGDVSPDALNSSI